MVILNLLYVCLFLFTNDLQEPFFKSRPINIVWPIFGAVKRIIKPISSSFTFYDCNFSNLILYWLANVSVFYRVSSPWLIRLQLIMKNSIMKKTFPPQINHWKLFAYIQYISCWNNNINNGSIIFSIWGKIIQDKFEL